jgi:hypothetical protein
MLGAAVMRGQNRGSGLPLRRPEVDRIAMGRPVLGPTGYVRLGSRDEPEILTEVQLLVGSTINEPGRNWARFHWKGGPDLCPPLAKN